MKFASYKATPGLERYPELERFRVWRATHKRLLAENAAYRRTHYRYFVGIVGLVTASGGCGILGPVLGQFAFAFSALAIMTLLVAWLAFKHQLFMNKEIGRSLQRTT